MRLQLRNENDCVIKSGDPSRKHICDSTHNRLSCATLQWLHPRAVPCRREAALLVQAVGLLYGVCRSVPRQ